MKILIAITTLLLSACSSSTQQPICNATAMLGGQEQQVQIYGVRKIANQTEYQASYPFNWRWVSKGNFTRSTCQ